METVEALGKSAFKQATSAISDAKLKADGLIGTDIEKKVKEATFNKPQGCSGSIKNEISRATYDTEYYSQIMPIIWKRLEEKSQLVVFKTLTLLEHLIKNGSERVVDEAKCRIGRVKKLQNYYNYENDTGIDRGSGIRELSRRICDLLHNYQKLSSVRIEARKQRSKMERIGNSGFGIGGGGGFGGNFNNEKFDDFGNGDDDFSSNWNSYNGGKSIIDNCRKVDKEFSDNSLSEEEEPKPFRGSRKKSDRKSHRNSKKHTTSDKNKNRKIKKELDVEVDSGYISEDEDDQNYERQKNIGKHKSKSKHKHKSEHKKSNISQQQNLQNVSLNSENKNEGVAQLLDFESTTVNNNFSNNIDSMFDQISSTNFFESAECVNNENANNLKPNLKSQDLLFDTNENDDQLLPASNANTHTNTNFNKALDSNKDDILESVFNSENKELFTNFEKVSLSNENTDEFAEFVSVKVNDENSHNLPKIEAKEKNKPKKDDAWNAGSTLIDLDDLRHSKKMGTIGSHKIRETRKGQHKSMLEMSQSKSSHTQSQSTFTQQTKIDSPYF